MKKRTKAKVLAANARKLAMNAFCPTGVGGGQDNSCSRSAGEPTVTVDTDNKFEAEFSSPIGKFVVKAECVLPCIRGKKEFKIEFEHVDEHGETHVEKTGMAGIKAVGIFRSVGKAVDKFMDLFTPYKVKFTADNDEPSRVKLYDRLALSLSKSKGYSLSTTHDGQVSVYSLTTNSLSHNSPRKTFYEVYDSLVINPFVSEAQRRACYAQHDAGWDCSEWSAVTPKGKLPARKKRKLMANIRRRLLANVKAPNPLKIDPTRTLMMRRAFAQRLRKAFALLMGRIVKLVVDDDAFGLGRTKQLSSNVVANEHPYVALLSQEKVRAFQDWLRRQNHDLLTSQTQKELWLRYAEQGFRKGQGRAFDDVRQSKLAVSRPDLVGPEAQRSLSDFYQGTKDEFLRSSFGRPVAVEKVQLLAGRSFDDLENVTDDMSARMSRSLADGMVRGASPHEVAKDMADDLDVSRARAETIARTEIIRAHAEGQLQALGDLGVEEVGVAVEWSTTGDDKVCPLCQPLEGVVLKLDEARGMLPRHPNCRCAWIPANVGESDKGQKDTKSSIDRAFKESDLEVTVGRNRPQSILDNAFCPTGVGGGQDNSCSPGGRDEHVEIHDKATNEVYFRGPRHEAEEMVKAQEEESGPDHGLGIRPAEVGGAEREAAAREERMRQHEEGVAEIHRQASLKTPEGLLPGHKEYVEPPPVLYHATYAADAIKQGGFKTSDELGSQVLGGTASGRVSFTTKENAEKYRDALDVARKAAQGTISHEELVDAGTKFGVTKQRMRSIVAESAHKNDDHFSALQQVAFEGKQFPLFMGGSWSQSVRTAKEPSIVSVKTSGVKDIRYNPGETEWRVGDKGLITNVVTNANPEGINQWSEGDRVQHTNPRTGKVTEGTVKRVITKGADAGKVEVDHPSEGYSLKYHPAMLQRAGAGLDLHDSKALAGAVHEAGRSLPDWQGAGASGKRAGDQHKVHVADLHEALKSKLGGASLPTFKDTLAKAHSAGHVTLSRQDIPDEGGKMASSEVTHGNATFHRVNVPLPVSNAFCPTGEGGGHDNSCSPGGNEPKVLTVGEGHSGKLLHGTTDKSANHFLAGTDLHEGERSRTLSEWGSDVIYSSDVDAPHQALMFASGKSQGKGGTRKLLEFQLKPGSKVLDLADEVTRRPAVAFGGGPEQVAFKDRPSITDDMHRWLKDVRAAKGAPERDVSHYVDPKHKDFEASEYLSTLKSYAKAKGYAAVRLHDETVIVDRSSIESARKIGKKELDDIKAKPRLRKPYSGGNLYSEFTSNTETWAWFDCLGYDV